MTPKHVELIEKLVDLKIKRQLSAAIVANDSSMEGPAILALMLPIEQAIETTLKELSIQ